MADTSGQENRNRADRLREAIRNAPPRWTTGPATAITPYKRPETPGELRHFIRQIRDEGVEASTMESLYHDVLDGRLSTDLVETVIASLEKERAETPLRPVKPGRSDGGTQD